ncbi:hypothetical protein F5887DRAFT_1080438 [Amanita rubescens]|nr:hypothetical protein F5887DRAFT_1080438 [Amanita rubescens]
MFAKVFSKLSLVLVAITFAENVIAQLEPCDRTYDIASGDTCSSIARANGVSNWQLSCLNPSIDSDCTNLNPDAGELLCLGINGHDCDITYTVASGDSCYSIAQAWGITLDTFYANNPNINPQCDNLRADEVVCTGSVLYYEDFECPDAL